VRKSGKSESRSKAKRLLGIITDKHPLAPLVLDLRGLNFVWDFFVIVSSSSGPHARAMADELIKVSKDEGFSVHHIEKDDEDEWYLIDYTDVCFHIFSQDKRQFYSLERLFKDAKKIRFRFKPGK
jgi:ribosome-associated protein